MITIKAKNSSKILDKSLGLLVKTKPIPIYFKTRFGIHTLGLRFPIDVLIMDDQCRVMKLKERLKPNRIFLWNPRFENVLELPQGWIKEKRIKLGEQIMLLFVS